MNLVLGVRLRTLVMHNYHCRNHCRPKKSDANILIFVPVLARTLADVRPGFRCGLRGATVARLTPDQKVACSNHVGVNVLLTFRC